MVREVSATLVARTTLRTPSGVFSKHYLLLLMMMMINDDDDSQRL